MQLPQRSLLILLHHFPLSPHHSLNPVYLLDCCIKLRRDARDELLP